MRYYFHIRNGDELICDPEGSVCTNVAVAIKEAKAHAREVMAARLKSGREMDGQTFEIVDEKGFLADYLL